MNINNENDVIIEKDNDIYNIDKYATVIRTDLGRYTKIVHIANQVNTKPCIKKLSKDTYFDFRVNQVKNYNKEKLTDLKSVKKKLRRYEEKVLYNFIGSPKEIFVTLSCKYNVTDIKQIKCYYDTFIDKVKQETDYENIEHIGLFEQTANWNWHVHAFIKTTDDKSLYIEQSKLLKIWRESGATAGGVYVYQNLNTMQSLNHSKEKRRERLDRFRYYPKGEKMYKSSKGILNPPKEKIRYGDCEEVKCADNFKKISDRSYIIRNANTDSIINRNTTKLFKKKIITDDTKNKGKEEKQKGNVKDTQSETTIKPNDIKNKTNTKHKHRKIVLITIFLLFVLQSIIQRIIDFIKKYLE